MSASEDGLRSLFRSPRLQDFAAGAAPDYAAAKPFPHVVIDDFLPEPVAARILDEFPSTTAPVWDHYDKSIYSKKLAANREEQVGAFVYRVLQDMNGADCLAFLERLTGIPGLVPDPRLEGGGLHAILPGGFLKVHADFNLQASTRLDRRLNLLLYLNRDWAEHYGGHLELWNREMTECQARILPVFNRAVIFSTTDWSYHGHPDPLRCPEGMARKSMALYYYSRGRPESEASASHGTLWQTRPVEPGGPRMALARRLRGLARFLEGVPHALRNAANRLEGLPPSPRD